MQSASSSALGLQTLAVKGFYPEARALSVVPSMATVPFEAVTVYSSLLWLLDPFKATLLLVEAAMLKEILPT